MAFVKLQPELSDLSRDARHAEALLKTGALQSSSFNSANFSSIATDAKGVIQIFNVGRSGCSATQRPRSSTRPPRPTSSIPGGERALKAGASAYLQKPWNDDELLNTIRSLLGELQTRSNRDTDGSSDSR